MVFLLIIDFWLGWENNFCFGQIDRQKYAREDVPANRKGAEPYFCTATVLLYVHTSRYIAASQHQSEDTRTRHQRTITPGIRYNHPHKTEKIL